MAPFGQVESGLNRRHEGNGLGLPLNQVLAELHGGEMTIESALGEGTMVTVTVPSQRIRRLRIDQRCLQELTPLPNKQFA